MGRFIASDTAPSSPIAGDVWFNSLTGVSYIFFDSFWVELGSGSQGPQGAASTSVGPQGPTGPAGAAGAAGSQGPQGVQGATGEGVATGGTIGQALVKTSATNYATEWASIGSAARPLLTGGAYLDGSGLVLGGLASNYASTPDSAALSITGDIDIQVKVALDDWTSANVLISKRTGGTSIDQPYEFAVLGSGLLRFIWANGTTNFIQDSTIAPTVSDGDSLWVRVTLDVDNGATGNDVTFFTSTDGTAWTQLGSVVTTAGTTSIIDDAASLAIGVRGASGSPTSGTVYRAIVKNGIDGTTVFDADFSDQTADALAFNATGDMGIKADGLVLKGVSGQYASTPDAAVLDIAGDIDIAVRVALTDWTPASGGPQALISKRLNSNVSYSLFVRDAANSGKLLLETSGDGSTARNATSSVAPTVSDGQALWVRATRASSSGSTVFYTAPDSPTYPTVWTQLGTTISTPAGAIFASTANLVVGSQSAGTSTMLNGTVYRAIVKDGIGGTTVYDADFNAQPSGTISFVESSSNAAAVTVNGGTNSTVTINTTRYSYGVPEMQGSSVVSQVLNPNRDFYFPFRITQSLIVDMFGFEVTTGPASASTTYMAIYNADNDLQPVGSPVATASAAVAASTAGVGLYRLQFTPVTLPAGNYVIGLNSSVQTTYRTIRGGVSSLIETIGATPFITTPQVVRTAAAFSASPLPWVEKGTGNSGSLNPIHLRYKAAT
jgi:hypothetical protein